MANEWQVGFWNGLETKVRKVSGTVRTWKEDDAPQAWWKHLAGTKVLAVEVVLDGVNYGGGTIFLADDDGQGWYKVTEGRGSPRIGHKELPLVGVERV